MKNLKKYYYTITSLIFLALPLKVYAELPKFACPEGLRCPGQGGSGLGLSTVNGLIGQVINYLLGIVFALAVLFIVIGGLRYIVSGGNAESAEAGKKTIINAIIGIIIVILAYVIINVVSNTVSSTQIIP